MHSGKMQSSLTINPIPFIAHTDLFSTLVMYNTVLLLKCINIFPFNSCTCYTVEFSSRVIWVFFFIQILYFHFSTRTGHIIIEKVLTNSNTAERRLVKIWCKQYVSNSLYVRFLHEKESPAASYSLSCGFSYY